MSTKSKATPPPEPTPEPTPAPDRVPHGTLAAALSAFQRDCPPVARNNTGQVRGKENYRYAGLDAVVETARPHLARHGLAVFQGFVWLNPGWALETRLIHADTGEQLTTLYPASMDSTPQNNGSETTYLRRYSYLAAIGAVVANEDDDGAAATQAYRDARIPARAERSPARPAPAEPRPDPAKSTLVKSKSVNQVTADLRALFELTVSKYKDAKEPEPATLAMQHFETYLRSLGKFPKPQPGEKLLDVVPLAVQTAALEAVKAGGGEVLPWIPDYAPPEAVAPVDDLAVGPEVSF